MTLGFSGYFLQVGSTTNFVRSYVVQLVSHNGLWFDQCNLVFQHSFRYYIYFLRFPSFFFQYKSPSASKVSEGESFENVPS